MKQNRFFRSLLFLAIPLSLFLSAFSLTAQSLSPVLSPAEGVWANYQSLVLDLPAGAEAFYSLNGEDPAVSGFAYDGPTLLNVSGNVRLMLVIIGSGGTERFEIAYTVVLRETPAYMQAAFERSPANGVFAEVNASSYIDIPPALSYSIAQTGKILSGRRLAFREASVFERCIPLVIYDGDVPFRYMLRTGGDGGLPGTGSDGESDSGEKAPVEFIDWNYARFDIDGPLVYSIDGGAPRVSESGKIRVDRSEVRSIRWKAGILSGGADSSSGGFHTLSVPARPELRGEPLRAVVNDAVRLSFTDKDFVFCVTAKDGRKLFSPVFTVDILEGDAFGFSQHIDVYYKGIKQGSVRPSFIIDKIPPAPPAFISSESGFYARDSLQVSLTSDADIYYYAAPVIKSKTGFTASDIQKINAKTAPVDAENFVRLAEKIPHLKAGEKEALLYTLYAYSLDTAGNRSAIVRFQTVVDRINYYAASLSEAEGKSGVFAAEGAAEFGDGSPDKPFRDFSSLSSALQKSPSSFVRCFISGSFTGLHSLEITRDTEIIGDGNTRLVFEKGASLKVQDALFGLKDSSIEQLYGGLSDIFQNRLIEAENARLVFSGAELICKDPNSAVCISAANSSVTAENTGISVEAPIYAEALNLRSSAAEFTNLRTVVIAATALGLKSSRSSAVIDNSSFRLLGSLVRALEFTDSGFMLNSNRFIAEVPSAPYPNKKTPSVKSVSSAAVWTNTSVPEVSPSGGETNTYAGFTSLYGGFVVGGLPAPGGSSADGL